jgi:hypothetical protein
MFFNIGNLTGEPIEVKFIICDDLLYEGLKKNITQRLENTERIEVVFSVNQFYNRGNTDPTNVETFMSIFESFSVTLLDSGIVLYSDDMSRNSVKYEKTGLTSHSFTLEIKHPQAARQ